MVNANEEMTRRRGAAAAIAALETNYGSQFKRAKDRRSWISELTPENFEDFLGQSNGLLRAEERQSTTFDASDRMITMEVGGIGSQAMLIAPPVESRRPLLIQALYAAKQIADNQELSDQEANRRIGLLVAGTINLLHGFKEGNGRLGRWFSYLMDQGFDGSPRSTKKLTEAVKGEGGRKWNTRNTNFDTQLVQMVKDEVSLDLPKVKLYDFSTMPRPLYRGEVTYDLAPDEITAMMNVMDDSSLGALATQEVFYRKRWMQKKGEGDDEFFAMEDSFIVDSDSYLEPFRVFKGLDPNVMREVIKRHKELQVRKIQIFLAEMSSPVPSLRGFNTQTVDFGVSPPTIHEDPKKLPLPQAYAQQLRSSPLLQRWPWQRMGRPGGVFKRR